MSSLQSLLTPDYESGYVRAMKAAGAEVLAYREFGSYQGDFLAKVRYQGRTFWVHDYYGSCSGCDAFEAEFSWGDEEKRPDDLAAFGKRYLDDYEEPLEKIREQASRISGYGADDAEVLSFIEAVEGAQ